MWAMPRSTSPWTSADLFPILYAAAALGKIPPEEAQARKAQIRRRMDMLRSGAFGERRMQAKRSQVQAYQKACAQKGGL